MRNIVYVSGSRADYGPVRRVLQAVQQQPDQRLSLVVTGMHLDPAHGETWREIENDGFNIAERVYSHIVGDSLEAMAGSLGITLFGMSMAIRRIRPDIVMVLGDRGEALAGAMAGAFQNVVVVHLCGGSLSGSIDDSIRHAITKMAHYHVPAFEEHGRRLVQMGEDPSTVFDLGLPGGDIRADVTFSREAIYAEYGIPPEKGYILVIQHPVTHSHAHAASQITETLEAVATTGHTALLANPNDDAGGRAILTKIREYSGRYPQLRQLAPPRSRQKFASIMAHAMVLVGNSSSAVAEAMSVELPVVNVGDRQHGREHLACWINVNYQREEIQQAIETALQNLSYRSRLKQFSNNVRHKDVSSGVVSLLRDLDLERARRPKTFYDQPAKHSP